jgi:regulator of ribosome biosynthesis
LTKWAKFAQESGIKKKKKDNLEWDKITNSWVPRYGYKSKKGVEDEWLVNAKSTDEIGKDPWINAREEKREKIKKQKERQVKNVKSHEKEKVNKLPGNLKERNTLFTIN